MAHLTIRHATLQFEKYDSIILTQSCDLENEKVGDILLAQVSNGPPWSARNCRGVISSSRARNIARH